MNRSRLRRLVLRNAKVACAAMAVLLLFYEAVRHKHDLPWLFPGNSRVVTLDGGRIRLSLPRRWQAEDVRDDNRGAIFSDATLGMKLVVMFGNVTTREDTTTGNLVQTLVDGKGPAVPLPGGRSASLTRSVEDIDGQLMDMQQQVVAIPLKPHEFLYIRARFFSVKGSSWLPTVAADRDFIAQAVEEVRTPSHRDFAVERDRSGVVSESADALREFEVSAWIVEAAFVVFCLTWVIGYLVFEKAMKLSKLGYTRVSQATTLLSFIGLVLGSAAYFTTRMDQRMKLAEVAADNEAEKAISFLGDLKDMCDLQAGSTISFEPEPGVAEDAVPFECASLVPVIEQLAHHFQKARLSVLRAGNFVDPNWRLGLPITMFVVQGRVIIDRDNALSEGQRQALRDRYFFYMDAFESAVRVVQSQQDYLELSRLHVEMNKVWGVFLAAALALTMVKHSGDKRMELEKIREKLREAEISKGSAVTVAPPVAEAPPPEGAPDHGNVK